MTHAAVDLSDVLPRYAVEIEAFRAAARAVARDIYWEHLREPLASRPLAEVRASSQDFGRRLIDYLVDLGDLVADGDRLRPAASLVERERSSDAVAAYAAANPRRESVAYFLTGCREVAGGVLSGGDGFRLVRARDPRRVAERWEHLMLEAPILEPCRAFAARALASRLTEGSVVFEGGAGVGVVLRTLLRDESLAARVDRVARYHYTELDPAIMAAGRHALSREAPASLQRALAFKRLDLDVFARDPATSGLAPASVDCAVFEHVLYDVEDLHATLVALRGVLRPGGVVIFTGAFRGRAATFFPCEMLQLTLASYRRAKLDPPYRTTVGYLSFDEWERSLSRAGFALAAQPAPDDHARLPHGGVVAWAA